MKSKSTKLNRKGWFPKAAKLSLVGAIAAALNPAAALEVTGSFTGFWDQPDQENHGLILQIATQASGQKVGVGYWAFYDQMGNESWLYAEGEINGNTLNATLFDIEGVTFLQPVNPDVNPANPVGTMQIQFNDCNSGNVDFETPQVIVGTGGFRIQRITSQPGVNCTGGISDDIPPNAIPQSFDIDLLPTGAFPEASGDVEYEQGPGRAELDIEIEDLPVGEYTLQVGGITRGTIQVVLDDDDGDTEGEIEFSSPQDDDELLLDFDPRDQIIDILQGNTVVLTTMAPATGTPPGTEQGNPPALDGEDIDIDLNNDGVYPEGEGDADLDFGDNRVEFEVEIEEVPVGSYTLVVAGIERGQIQVVNVDDEPEGDIEFVYPPTPGSLPLDFDPRGERLEVFEGNTRIFFADFPLVNDSNDGNNDGSSGGNDDDNSPQDVDIDRELTNTGVFPDASASADYDRDDASASFDVDLDDVPGGSYSLVVDGVVRGQIMVDSDDDDEGDGELSFSNPLDDDDDLPLDFDPRGTLVEIFDGETRLFFIDFPQA